MCVGGGTFGRVNVLVNSRKEHSMTWYLLCIAIVLMLPTRLIAQFISSPEMHIECSRGVYSVAATGMSGDGSIVVGGEYGRYGIKRVGEESFRWRCLPTQFTITAAVHADSVVVLGGEEGSVWIVPAEQDGNGDIEEYVRAFLPQTATVTALYIRDNVLYAATASGTIWSRSMEHEDTWIAEYDGGVGFLTMSGLGDHVVASGRDGMIVHRTDQDRRWRELSLDTLNTEGLLLSALTVTDSVIYVGTSRPSVIRIRASDNGVDVVVDETMVVPTTGGRRGDHLGLPERVLSIQVNSDTIWLSGYFIPSGGRSEGTSLHRSVNGGATYQRHRYMEKFGPLLRSDFMPVMRVGGDTILALSATLGHPITIFLGSVRDSVLGFTSQQNIWENYIRTDGTSQGLQSTIVMSLLPHPDGERLIASLMNGPNSASDESQTYVCEIQPAGNATTVDTISRIPGRFILQAIKGEYVVGYDYLGYPRCSFDRGRTWRSASIPDSITEATLTGFEAVMMFDSLLLCHYATALVVADTGLRQWSMMRPETGDTITHFSRPIPSGGNRFTVVRSSWVEQRLVLERILECEFRGRNIAVISERMAPRPFPLARTAAYFDRGVLTAVSTVRSDVLPDILFQHRMCQWIDSAWTCSKISVQLPTGEEVNQFQSTIVLESATDDIVLLSSAAGSDFYGMGQPRRWQSLPGIVRMRSVNSRYVLLNNKLYVGGNFHGLYSYAVDNIVTSVQEEDTKSAAEAWTDHQREHPCSGPDSIYTLQGQQVGNSPSDVRLDGVYVIRSCDGRGSLGLILDGRLVARQAP